MPPINQQEEAVFHSPLDRVLHRKRLTNVWLGNMVGCGESEISRYRHGVRIPPLKRQIKICRALDCDLSDLWPKTKKPCETCKVNEVEYQDDYECAWCREKRRTPDRAFWRE